MDNKKIVADYYRKVLNEGNTGIISDFVSREYTEVFNGRKYRVGIEGAVKHITGVRETYPDINLSIQEQFSDGDHVITCYVMTGTHSGSWMGMKPTFRRLSCTGVNIDRVAGGRIVEHGGAANLFESLLEIGAISINS